MERFNGIICWRNLALVGAILFLSSHITLLEAQAVYKDQRVNKRILNRQARITSITAFDQGQFSDSNSGDYSLDTLQNSCDSGDDEPFFDTLVSLKVLNNSQSRIRIRRIRYIVKKSANNQVKVKSSRLSPLGNLEIGPESEASILSLFLDTDGSDKYFAGAEQAIGDGVGFRNVRFVLIGRDFFKRRVRIKASTAFSFGNIDRCD